MKKSGKRCWIVLCVSLLAVLLGACGKQGGNASKNNLNFDDVSAGDIVEFGSFEQDNNTKNGAENLEWIVLEAKDNTLVLLSEKVLKWTGYDQESPDWDSSDVREWLNDEFYPTAFNEKEKQMIQLSRVMGEIGYTEDYVYLLSVAEARKYFSYNTGLRDVEIGAAPTAYAKAHGALSNEEYNGNCNFWLRTPAEKRGSVCYVNRDGSFGYGSSTLIWSESGIRPVICITTGE